MSELSKIKTFAVIGGDKRQLYLADSLARDGFRVILGGFDKLLSVGAVALTDVSGALRCCDAAIFPLPCLRMDNSLNTPFSDEKRYLSEKDCDLLSQILVCAGMADKLLRAYPFLQKGRVFDYSGREDFAVLNAVPTAEGAIQRAMEEYEGTIAGSRVLIVGFGRIGKVLARLLHALNADVTVTARKPGDLAMIRALGYKAADTAALKGVDGADIVFNTVPALVFDRELLKNTDPDTLIIDLASLPGGVNFEAAKTLGIDAVRALSLPGRCAPKTAGEIIKTTVYHILS